MGKIVKKIAMGVLALTCTFGCVGTFTACDEGNPEAQIVLEFNGQEYTLNYQLHKDRTPKTVNHFIWLVENQYYDGLCVHNYQAGSSGKLYTGAYEVDANGNLDYRDYYEFVQTTKGFTHTVWRDAEKEDPLFTLYGEFKENGFNVGQNNRDALKQEYGSLAMFYHTTGKDGVDVFVANPNGSETPIKKVSGYSKNSATSMFSISTATSAKLEEGRCTFATLNNKDVLEDLEEAIADYIEDNEEFVTETTVTQDPGDSIVGKKNLQVKYQVPNEPIEIKSARITKY